MCGAFWDLEILRIMLMNIKDREKLVGNSNNPPDKKLIIQTENKNAYFLHYAMCIITN